MSPIPRRQVIGLPSFGCGPTTLSGGTSSLSHRETSTQPIAELRIFEEVLGLVRLILPRAQSSKLTEGERHAWRQSFEEQVRWSLD